MKCRIFLLLAAFSMPALANPRVESVEVKPNPVPFQGEVIPEIVIAVTIARPNPLDLTCQAVVDPGDEGRPAHINWAVGDPSTKTMRHEYKRPGTYRLIVRGSGTDPCAGQAEATVTVLSRRTRVAKTDSALLNCPRGWSIDPASVKGARFTCRANPPAQPIKCAEGTKYFSEDGSIGCR